MIEKRDDTLPGGGRLPTNEEFRELTDAGGAICAKWCADCDKHYAWCSCLDPTWKIRNEGKLGPMVGEPGGPTSLMELL